MPEAYVSNSNINLAHYAEKLLSESFLFSGGVNFDNEPFTTYIVDTTTYICTIDILFSSNHNIHKSSCGHRFWA